MKTVVLGNGYLNQYWQCAASRDSDGAGVTAAIRPPADSNNGGSDLLFHLPDDTVIRTPIPFPNVEGTPDTTYTPGKIRSIEWYGDFTIFILVVNEVLRTSVVHEFNLSNDLATATFVGQREMLRPDPFENNPILVKTSIGGMFYIGISVKSLEQTDGAWHLQWMVCYRNVLGNWEDRLIEPVLATDPRAWIAQNMVCAAQHPDGPILAWMVHDSTGVLQHLRITEGGNTFTTFSDPAWTYTASAPPCDGELPFLLAIPDYSLNVVKLLYQAYPPNFFSDGAAGRLYLKGNRISISDVRSDSSISARDVTDSYTDFLASFAAMLNGNGDLSILFKHIDGNIGSLDGVTPLIRELRITTKRSGSTIWETAFFDNGPIMLGTFIGTARLKPFGYCKLENNDNVVVMPDAVLPPSPPPPPPAPAPPDGLTATTVSMSQINLAWNDASNAETGFKIERGPDGVNWTQIATAPTNATSYADAGLAPNTTYYYRIRAFNEAGDSAYTAIAQATTQADTPPLVFPLSIDVGIIRRGRGISVTFTVSSVVAGWSYSLKAFGPDNVAYFATQGALTTSSRLRTSFSVNKTKPRGQWRVEVSAQKSGYSDAFASAVFTI